MLAAMLVLLHIILTLMRIRVLKAMASLAEGSWPPILDSLAVEISADRGQTAPVSDLLDEH